MVKKPHEVETVDLSGPGEEGSLDRDSSNNPDEDRLHTRRQSVGDHSVANRAQRDAR